MNRTGMTIIGVLLIILSALCGIYLGIWVMFIGGIVDIMNACKMTPIDAWLILWGLIKFFCSGFVGWGSFIMGATFGYAFLKTAEEM